MVNIGSRYYLRHHYFVDNAISSKGAAVFSGLEEVMHYITKYKLSYNKACQDKYPMTISHLSIEDISDKQTYYIPFI